MFYPINSYDMSGIIDNHGMSSLKLEVKLPNVKLIPQYSWVDDYIAVSIPHNTAAPAFTTQDICFWYINGCRYYDTKLFSEHAKHDNETQLLWYLTYGDHLPMAPQAVKCIETSYKD